MDLSYKVYKQLSSLLATVGIGITQYILIFRQGLFGDPIEFLGELQWIMVSFILASTLLEISRLIRSTLKLNKSSLIIPINQNKKILHLRWMILIMFILIGLMTILMKVLLIKIYFIFLIIVLAFQYYLLSYKSGVYDAYIYYKGYFYVLNNLTKAYTYDNEVRMTFTIKKGPFRLTRKIELESEGHENEELVRVIKSRSNNF